MRKPSSPLRRVLAVLLSLLILPWQQPAFALADSSTPGAVVLGVKLDHPREALDALDRRLDALIERIKSADPKAPAATLPEDLVKLKTEYKAAQDGYIAAEKEAAEPAKALLKPLTEPSTGQLLADAIVENDLGGIRRDLAALSAAQASFSRPPAEIPAADWPAVEKAVPDFKAALTPLSSRVDKAKSQAKLPVAEVEDGYRPLAAELEKAFLDLRSSASRLNLDELLAAKPATVSGDAAGALMAEVARALPAQKAALLKPQLAEVNKKLAGYLHTGKPEDLQSALGEIDRLYDAARIKKIDRATMFERIGDAAQTQARAGEAARRDPAAVLTANGVERPSDMRSMHNPGLDRLPAAEPESQAGIAAAVSGWIAEGRAAAGPAWEALRKLIPESADPAAFVRDYALRGFSDLTRGRAAALKTENANEKAAKALADAYALIEAKVTAVVLEAPRLSADPRTAAANSAKALATLKRVEHELKKAETSGLGVKGPGVWGWSEAARPQLSEADAKAQAPARARAEALVALVSSLREQHEKGALDLTNLEDADRRQLLYADGKGAGAAPAAVGALGRAVILRSDAERKGLAALKALNLTGDAAKDAAALNLFFDNAENRAAAQEGTLPPMLADWGRARAFEKKNEELTAAGKPPLPRPAGQPGVEEAYSRIVVAQRYDRIKEIHDPTQKQMAELHESYFAMNRAAYVALGCDPALLAEAEGRGAGVVDRAADKGLALVESSLEAIPGARAIVAAAAPASREEAPPETLNPKRTAAFCAGFLKNVRRPSSYSRARFAEQKALADRIKPFLEDNDLARASAKSGKATAEMLAAMRGMSPELRAAYAARGVDVDGLLKQNDRAQVLQWAAVVRQLSLGGDDAGWREYRDGLIGRFYGDGSAAAVKAQADKLRAAVSSGDQAGVAASLADMQNPDLMTSGYLAALPGLLASERAPRSSRDRALLLKWNGGVKAGAAPPEGTYAGLLVGTAVAYEAAAAKPENQGVAAEYKRQAALMREVAADPSDPEKTAEALRVVEHSVWDARAVRVGMDTTKIPERPKNDEERRDLVAAMDLARVFLSKEESFRTAAGAEKIRRGLLAKLGGELPDAQEENRRDQLILSASDEHQDRVAKLGRVSSEMLAEAGPPAGAARRRVEGGASYQELLRMAGLVKAQQEASLELYSTTDRLSATAWGRASMTLPGLVASAKAQSVRALDNPATPDGLVLSGWMAGIAAGDVTVHRNHPTEGVSGRRELPPDQRAVVRHEAGNPDVPPAAAPRRRDLISYVQKDGSTIFRTTDGSFSQTRSPKTEQVKVGGQVINATVSSGVNAAGERVDIYTAGGKSFVVEKKGFVDASGVNRTSTSRRAVTGVTSIVPLESVQTVTSVNGRRAVSVIEKRGSETLSESRFYAPEKKGQAYDIVTTDFAGHSLSVTAGDRRTVFDLAKDNAHLDDSRRRTTFDVSGGGQKLIETRYFVKDEHGSVAKAVVERPRTDLGIDGAVVEIRDYRLKSDTGDDNKRDGFGRQVTPNRIGRLDGAALDKAIVGGLLVEDRRPDDRGGPRVDFRVTLNREGKTNAQLADAYGAAGARIAAAMGLRRDDKSSMAGDFAGQFKGLARFYDNQFVAKDAAYAVTANISRGGTVSMSGMRFDAARMRDASVDPSPQFTFVQLPTGAPQRQAGLPAKEQNGILLAQELWAVGKASNEKFAFVTIAAGEAGGRDHVTGFFGKYNGVEKNHKFRADEYDENRTDGNGHWFHAADIIRAYYVDGARAGKIVADQTTSIWNAGAQAGTWVNNSIRYSDWGRRNPKTAAFVGGVAGGVIMTLGDPVMLGMMVIPMGAGYVAAKIGAGAFKAFKVIEAGVNAYFMAGMIVSTGEGVYKVAAGVVKDDANMINEGGMAVGAAVAMGVQMGVSHWLAGRSGAKEPGTEPGGKSVEPGGKPVEPAAKPAEPGGEPVEPGGRPVEPGGRPVEPGGRPVEPGGRSVEPGGRPVEPGGRPVEPGGRPVEPGGRPVEPGGRPVEPSGRGGRPMEPARPPATPVRPGPRLAEAPGFKGSNLDAPSAGAGGGGGGGGAELSPVGTKSAANAGGPSGASAAPKPAEAAAAAKAPEAPSAPAQPAAKASPAPEPAAPKTRAEALPEAAAQAAPRPAAEAARPLERVGSEGAPATAEASMLIGEPGGGGRARPLIEGRAERGPVERGPIERRGPVERAPADSAPERAYDEPSREASIEPARPRTAPEAPAPKEPRGAEPARDTPAAPEPAPAEMPGQRANADAQHEANALVGDGASAPAPAPAAKPGLVKRGLARADSAFGEAMKPVGALWDAAASLASRAGRGKLPFTETPLAKIAGNAVRGLQTLGVGVEGIGARFGFLGSPLKGIGMMLQGRVLPHEGRPLTLEEVWHPDLAKRPSFLEAASAEAKALGGTVEGRFDPETGRAAFGPKAKGSVEIAVEVRPDGRGGVEIMDYRVKSADPVLEARAHGEMYGQLERSFAVEGHQAGLDKFFGDKATLARLAENGRLDGESFLDVTYDAGARRFRLAEPGRGEARLRFEAEPSGGLRLVEAEPLVEGARLPPAAEYNLRMFSARRGVSAGEGAAAGATLTPEERGARYAERLKAERVRVEQENVVRAALAESRVESARAKLGDAPAGGAGEGLGKVRETARAVAELRIERETAAAEMEAASRHLESLKIPKETVARAEEALTARERAGRELEKAEAEYDAGVPGALERGRAAAARFRLADENAARAGGGLTDSAVDALVRRQAGSRKVAAIEAAGRVAQRELRSAVREARGGAESPAERKAAVREALALERLAAAEAALAKDGAIREYRRDGLHRSTGGDGRRVAMMRMLAREGVLETGRASVGQEAGKNLCVVATAADMAATRSGRPAEGAMAEAEAAIIAHHQAKAKAAGDQGWEAAGREAGEAFLRDVAKSGMSGPEMREMMGAVAEASGLKLVEIKAEDLFTRLSEGGQIAVVMTHVADATGGIGGGAHMVNLSNWRQARNAVTGRVETMIDVADPNVRVLAGRDASGAPVYEARTVAMPLSEIVPELRGSLHAENGRAAGYAFEPAAGAGPRGPPERSASEQAARMGGSSGAFAAEAAPAVKAPAGYEGRGPGKVLDPNLLPVEIYSPEIMAAARGHGIVFEATPGTLERMKPGVDHNFVIVANPNGTIEMTVGRLAQGNVKEVGVKHVALGDGRPVLFSGSARVDPATGRPALDFNSGMYSKVGLDRRWEPTPENARALAAHAEAILKTRVDVVDHFSGRPIEFREAAPEGVGALASISRGASRSEGWIVDGRPARRLSAGGFKEVLIHPADEGLVIKLFTLTGAKDSAGSLAEKRLEMRNMQPLLDIGRAPRVVEQGAVEYESPSSGRMNAGYIVQERVVGRDLGEMLRDPDAGVRSRALTEARSLFEELIASRIKLEDRVKMSENISVGRAAGAGAEKAWVLDAGEASRVAKPGILDGLLGRPDPLRVYYEGVLRELSATPRRAATAAAKVEGVGSKPDAARYERYFSVAEIRAAHPEPASGRVYHDWQHTVKVADMAGEFARARGLGEAQAKFVSEVALLHDFDPSRAAGKPARVLSTLEALRADFAGTTSLNGEAGRSVLKERFGWTERQLKMAEAMIQRTEFPFAEKHPNPAYAEKSPLARYTEMLEGLPPGDRRFVLREAALLSEYADKSSWYATASYKDAHGAVEGLVAEIGVPSVTAGTLGTSGFLKVIGEPASFSHDAALAKRFGVKLELPNRAEAFALLPEQYGRTFEANLKGFAEFDAASKAGEAPAAAYERARSVADAAFSEAAPLRATSRDGSLTIEGVGAGEGFFGGLFRGREKAPAAPERIVWPVEQGGPSPARLEFAALKLDGPLKNVEAVHSNVLAVELGGRKAVLKVDAKPNEARVLAAMAEVPLPSNVRVPRLLGDAPADAMALHRLAEGAPGAVDYTAVKRAAAEGRHMIAVERLPDDFVSMLQVTNGSARLKEPISRADWQGLLDAVKAFSRRDMGFGDLGNETNIRLRQVADGKGGVRTEFALIDAGQGTLKGRMETLASDYVQLKGDGALETRLIDKRLLEGRGSLPDPRLAAMARNQVPQSQKLATDLNALMKAERGGRPSAAASGQGRRFTDLAQAAAYLKAPGGMTILAKTSEGLAGDTVKVEVAGEEWYLKRVSKKLGETVDDGLRGLSPAERAGNELAMREIVRRWFPETFRVAPEAISIEHGGEIFVMTKGSPVEPAPERLQMMTAAEHADYALLRLVFRAEDLNRGNVLFGKDGKPTLIDFEKVIAEPLRTDAVARGAANELLVKGFPVVSMKANDMAVYRAHAEKLRARFDDPNFTARLTQVLDQAGWTPERSAAYLKAVEANLKNFEANLAPYVAEANKVIAKRLEGVGAADGMFDGPPDAVRTRQTSDKRSPLRQMQISLGARGKDAVFKEAEAIFYTDGLTGLPNRAFIMEKAESLLAGVKEPTVAMLDMNNFGAVNAGLADVHGPVAGKELGDGMLADAGPKISAIAAKAGVHAARLGGEEIVVFGSMNDVIDFAAAMRKAFPPNKVLRDAKVGPKGEGIVPGGREWNAIQAAMTRMERTGPMGDFTYGLARTDGRAFETALKAADGVLNKAKAQGLRGAAVMEVPGETAFTVLRDGGTLAERVARLAEPPPFAPRPERLQAIKDLKAKLNDKEYAVFLEAAFKDPLSQTKTAEWVDMARPQWEAAYEGKGSAAMLSARNFKAVNDILGHAAGDLYLKKLGVIMRVEVNRLRKLGMSVEEPVRVGGKEFLLVGKDAAKVAGLVGEKFVAKLNAGEVLPGEQLERLRVEATARGLVPKDRASRLGDLRRVEEPFKGGFKRTYERLILELEAVKLREDRAHAPPAKPEGVGSGHEDIPGFLRGAAREPAAEKEKTLPPITPMSPERLRRHILSFELTSPTEGARYAPRQFTGGGHTLSSLARGITAVKESLAEKRALYAADQRELSALRARLAPDRKLARIVESGRPPAEGTHWTERADAPVWLRSYPNGVRQVVLPKDAYDRQAWRNMGMMTRYIDGYVQGGKTLFPKSWTEKDILRATDEAARTGTVIKSDEGGRIIRGTAVVGGVSVLLDVTLDASGRTSTSYPSWNQ